MVAGTATTTAMGRRVRSVCACACLLVAAPAAGVALPHGAIAPRSPLPGAAVSSADLRTTSASMVATVPDVPDAFDFDTLGERLDTSPIGVLLLSVGSPETKEDVEVYLYNVFCDPEILTLPPALMWALKRPVAWVSTHPSPSPRPDPHPHLTRRSREPGPSPSPSSNPSPNPNPHQAISKWRAPAARAAMLQASPNTTQVIQ